MEKLVRRRREGMNGIVGDRRRREKDQDDFSIEVAAVLKTPSANVIYTSVKL